MERGNDKLANALFNFEIGLEIFHCTAKWDSVQFGFSIVSPLSLWHHDITWHYIEPYFVVSIRATCKSSYRKSEWLLKVWSYFFLAPEEDWGWPSAERLSSSGHLTCFFYLKIKTMHGDSAVRGAGRTVGQPTYSDSHSFQEQLLILCAKLLIMK